MGLMSVHTCERCGAEFNGGARAQYCPECKPLVARESRDRLAAGIQPKADGVQYHWKTCIDCGVSFVGGSVAQRCMECKEKHKHAVAARLKAERMRRGHLLNLDQAAALMRKLGWKYEKIQRLEREEPELLWRTYNEAFGKQRK